MLSSNAKRIGTTQGSIIRSLPAQNRHTPETNPIQRPAVPRGTNVIAAEIFVIASVRTAEWAPLLSKAYQALYANGVERPSMSTTNRAGRP